MTDRLTNMPKLLLASAVAMGLIAASSAQAGQSTGNRSEERTVEYGDLDLGSVPGARAALQRIERAAVSICGSYRHIREPRVRAKFKNCVDETTSRAVKNLNAPVVSALHEGRMDEERLASGVKQAQK